MGKSIPDTSDPAIVNALGFIAGRKAIGRSKVISRFSSSVFDDLEVLQAVSCRSPGVRKRWAYSLTKIGRMILLAAELGAPQAKRDQQEEMARLGEMTDLVIDVSVRLNDLWTKRTPEILKRQLSTAGRSLSVEEARSITQGLSGAYGRALAALIEAAERYGDYLSDQPHRLKWLRRYVRAIQKVIEFDYYSLSPNRTSLDRLEEMREVLGTMLRVPGAAGSSRAQSESKTAQQKDNLIQAALFKDATLTHAGLMKATKLTHYQVSSSRTWQWMKAQLARAGAREDALRPELVKYLKKMVQEGRWPPKPNGKNNGIERMS